MPRLFIRPWLLVASLAISNAWAIDPLMDPRLSAAGRLYDHQGRYEGRIDDKYRLYDSQGRYMAG